MSQATIYVEGAFRDGYEGLFAEYSARVRAYLAKYDAKVVRRQRVTKTLYGAARCDLMMVIDLPGMDVAERMFFEPEYLAIIPMRDRIFSDFRMYVAEAGEV